MGTEKKVDNVETMKESNGRFDGWANIHTREGIPGQSKATGFEYLKDKKLTEQLVRDIYRSDGFGSKIVNKPVGDMTRQWFDIIGDTDGVINAFLACFYPEE